MSSGRTQSYNSGKRRDGKKVSWIYRQKKRQQKNTTQVEKTNVNSESLNKNARIIVRNLPFKATEENIRQLYSPFGKVEEINLLKHPDGSPVGCGFVQFQEVGDASRAIFNTNKKEFLGRVISSSWAIPKSKFCEKLNNQTETPEKQDTEDNVEAEPIQENETSENDRQELPRPTSFAKQKTRQLQKEKNRKKRARVIVRNLSFLATEEHLREYFSQYGKIEDVQILTKESGMKLGCAFIQFELVQSAAKAIHHANLKPLLDRPIIVDWAVAKNKFEKNSEETEQKDVEIKEEKESDTEQETVVKDDSVEPKDISLNKSVEALDSDAEVKEESEDVSDVVEDESMDEDGDEADDKDIEEIDAPEEQEAEPTKRPSYQSHDTAEGKTVFLKNVPFSVNNDQLKSYMQQFGQLYYALVCMDSLTEHSKGTAFVKFRHAEDAEKCLSAETKLEMEGQTVEAYKALERDEVENKARDKHRKEKDSRNLYLVKEGVVLAGSPAANGVSATDMAKRLQLDQWKSQMLRNLNMFVAKTRLVVHNVPASLDDTKLRKIFERHSLPKAVIREAKIMRDFRNVDAKGVGLSKEYGFVSYTSHEDALAALRNVNNNPKIFGPSKRPIVAFSIENRIMVNAKQKRVQKSREQNPLWPGHNQNQKRKNVDEGDKSRSKRPRIDNLNKPDVKSFTGTIGKPGESKLRSKFSLKKQAVLHNEVVKKAKKQKKFVKKQEARKEEVLRKRQEPKVKQGAKVVPDDIRFNKLVNSYKNKLQSIDLKKSKWYET